MSYKIINLTKNNVLLEKAEIAKTYGSRLKGLLGRTGLPKGEGLVITPCNSIHTIGMKFPIDVAFVDKNDTVVYIMENIPKGKLSPVIKKAKYVIEARAGEYKGKLEVGDRLELKIND